MHWRNIQLNQPLFMVICVVIAQGLTMDPGVLEIKVDAIAEKLLTCKDMVGFSVGVVQNGQQLMTKGYGYANIEKALPVTENTLFGIASLSKAFTSVLLTYLVDKHPEYTLDTPVRDILGPEFHFATCQLTNHATLRDLMSHRTGVLQYNTARMQENLTRDILVQKMRFFEPKFELRETYYYNNNMYGLLSKITEVVGGDTWENLIRKHIFEPLGMESSTFTHQTDLDSDNISLAYSRDWRDNFAWRPMSPTMHNYWGQSGGSGSILSSAADMIKWMQFQLSLGKDRHGNQVMPESVVMKTHRPHVVIPEEDCETCPFYRKPYLNVTYWRNTYALGWRVGFYRGERLVTHTGSSWGYTGMVSLLPDAGIAVHASVAGTDINYEGRRALHSYILDLLLGEEPQVTVENACNFPYYDRNSTQQISKESDNDTLPNEPEAIALEKVRPYIGTYGNFGFGNLTVFYNDTLQMLQMKYGFLGLWDLFTTEREHQFLGIGREHVWSLVLYPLVFGDTKEGGEMTRLTVEYFEPGNPPVFERGLQYIDAPPPKDCQQMCNAGIKVNCSFWMTLAIIIFVAFI